MSNVASEWESLKTTPILYAWAVAVSAIHIFINLTPYISGYWPNVIHFISFAVLCAGWGNTNPEPKLKKRFFYVIAAIGIAGALWMVLQEDALYDRGLRLSMAEWVAGFGLIISCLILTWRVAGWLIPVLIVVALGYVVWWGQYLPGVFRFAGLEVDTLLFRTVYGDDALFGSIARISSEFVMMFIIFGAFLIRSGAGEFIIELAKRAAGKMQGGPGLIAVFASGLTGTISGSAVANTASTGVITIPMMIKAGYKRRFAAGVEAASSTGGQLMPPIMGAGAFVMANYTQIPYTEIVVVALLPALLYFFTIGFFVRLEAKKENIQPSLEKSRFDSFRELMAHGGYSFIIPIFILIGLLMKGYSPTFTAGGAIAAVIVTSWFGSNKMGFQAITEALALAAKNMIMTAILLVTIGALVNVVSTTGIGNTFSFMIVDWAGGQLWLAIILIALASLLLGMGLPVTAAYIMVATIAAPALQQLILQTDLIEMLMNGTLSEGAKPYLMLIPDLAGINFSQPLNETQVEQVLANIPREIMPAVLDAAIDPTIATLALLSAHMIIFWLSQDSNVTPPVCLTAFTAGAIAKTPPMQAGISAWKLAKGLYIIPFLFAYTDILNGNWSTAIPIFLFSLLSLYLLVAFFIGHMAGPLNWVGRILCLVAGLVILWPEQNLMHFAGVGIGVVIYIFSYLGLLVGTKSGKAREFIPET